MRMTEPTYPDRMQPPRRRLALPLSLGLVVMLGCAPLDVKKKLAFWESDPKPKVPTRLVEFWSEEVLTEAGMPSVRGFAGRVMFYDQTESKPVAVDGTFTVFAFDDADRSKGLSAPEKKFVYLPDQLPKYYSKSQMGPSYSFWLPWDEVGGPERKICMVARFEPRKGAPIVSRPCYKTLPGKAPAPGEPGSTVMNISTSRSPGAVRPVSYEEPIGPAPTAQQATITIDVPPAFARRSLSAGQAEPSAPQAVPQAATSPSQETDRSATDSRSQAPAPEFRPAPSPASRFQRSRYPVQREPGFQPKLDPVRRQPLPAAWQFQLPPTPRSDPPGRAQESPTTGEPAPR